MSDILPREIFVGYHVSDTNYFYRLSESLSSYSISVISNYDSVNSESVSDAPSSSFGERTKGFEARLYDMSNDIFVFLISVAFTNDHFLTEQMNQAERLKKKVIGFVVDSSYKDDGKYATHLIDATYYYDEAVKHLVAVINGDTDITDKDEDTSGLAFTLDKVTICIGDLFDNNLINNSDLLIVPVSAQGSVTENIRQSLKRFDLYGFPENDLGTLTFVSGKKMDGEIEVGYAYSVDMGQSDYEAIEKICISLTAYLRKRPNLKVLMPLLGIGAGKLDSDQIATLYLKYFRNEKNLKALTVCIIEPDVFNSIQVPLAAQKVITSSNPDIKSRLHSDSFNIAEADILNYDIIAENIFSILTADETNPPLNIAIMAPWGRGKTSLMKRLQSKFDKKRAEEFSKRPDLITKESPKLKILKNWLNDNISVEQHIPYPTVWFNPWNYQSSDMIWAGLADAVITQVVDQIPGKIDKEIFWFKLRLSRINKEEIRRDLQTRAVLYTSQFIVWSLCIVFTILAYTFFKGAIITFISLFTGTLLGTITSVASSLKPYNKKITEAFERYTQTPKYADKTGTFHDVQADLKRVFELCIEEKKPLVVFVDDLDRCSPAKVVEVVEAINVFISGEYSNKCYFILGMDAEMVAAALDVAYEKMKGKMGSKELEQGSVGWYFLDKFIQLPFFIPVISETKKQEYLKTLLAEKETSVAAIGGEINKEKVNKVFVEVMNTTDTNVSSRAIKDASLTQEEKMSLQKKILDNQVNLKEQNEDINNQVSLYSRFISSDPRSLKRFANLLRFYSGYQFLRMKQGESYVKIHVLAKWLAIMLKFPQMIRWIQWDSENKSGTNNVAEEKVKMLDKLVEDFIGKHTSDIKNYDQWLNTDFMLSGSGEKIRELEEMPWLKSQKMFEILMNESSEEAKFLNALSCNVW